ncbi:unnamed protein product [Heligmosomoides polygyrus]|uniref:Uncharacterized protein n=1 Tax=Heligmosomoides polygyrus TaxID=6339 RepID=A0A183FE45_HELPZ|nr:unnamed protein product [Heligmosomoides polygyrus]
MVEDDVECLPLLSSNRPISPGHIARYPSDTCAADSFGVFGDATLDEDYHWMEHTISRLVEQREDAPIMHLCSELISFRQGRVI